MRRLIVHSLGVAVAGLACAVLSAGVVVPSQATPGPLAEAHPESSSIGSAAVAPLVLTPPYQPSRAPDQPVPTVTRTLPLDLDHQPEYQGQRACSPTAKPGAVKLRDLLRATYGVADIWIERACGDGGQSEHKEGRALDWMLNYKNPAERAKVEAFLWWALAPDADGNPAAMARRLGIMYMGWHDRIWRSYRAADDWTELKGCFSTPGASYDTYCHRDHLHITLSWDAAAGRTSFWDGTSEPLVACPEPTSATSLGAPLGQVINPVAAWRVLDTRAGRGTGTACRFEADRWSDDGRAVKISVLGRFGVPSTGVAAVRLRLGVYGVNAPTSVVASATGSTLARAVVVGGVSMGNAVTAAQNRSAGADILVPVSNAGTITLVNLYGAVDARAWVTGWVPIGPPPSEIAPFPGVTLTIGSRGDAVTSVQRALLKRGYAIASLAGANPVFGTFDSYTGAAVRRYQLKRPTLGVATGTVNRAWYRSITAVLAAPPPVPSVSLSAVVAHDPAATRVVQAALNTVLAAGLVVDGQWGPLTQSTYHTFRTTLGGVPDALPDDAPDQVSLTELGRRAGFTVVA